MICIDDLFAHLLVRLFDFSLVPSDGNTHVRFDFPIGITFVTCRVLTCISRPSVPLSTMNMASLRLNLRGPVVFSQPSRRAGGAAGFVM